MKSVLGEFHMQQQALSRFSLAAMVTSPPVLELIRRWLRKLSPDIKINIDQIRNVMTQEVLKREVVEGEKAEEAKKKVNRYFCKSTREKAKESKEALTQPEGDIIKQEPAHAGEPNSKGKEVKSH